MPAPGAARRTAAATVADSGDLTAGGAPQLLPGFQLQRLLACTHFSCVWAASRDATEPHVTGGGGAGSGATGTARDAGAGHVAGIGRGGAAARECVVIKALDAGRPSHAALAANEAAALRHLEAAAVAAATTAAAAAITTAAVATKPQATAAAAGGGTAAGGSQQGEEATAAIAAAAAPPGPPDSWRRRRLQAWAPAVRLLDTATADVDMRRLLQLLLPTAAASPAERCVGHGGAGGGSGAHERRVLTRQQQEAEKEQEEGQEPLWGAGAAAGAAAAAPAAGRRRWRCLVLEALGPTAADVLECWRAGGLGCGGGGGAGSGGGGGGRSAWAAGRGASGGAGGTGLEGRSAGGGGGGGARGAGAVEAGPADVRQEEQWRRRRRRCGLPPAAVRQFAAQALAALHVMHTHAELAHNDLKPSNFAWRQQPPGRAATCGGGVGERGSGDGGGAGHWALLDLGTACSLRREGQRVAEGPAGAGAKGYIRPCQSLVAAAAATGTDSDSEGGVGAAAATPIASSRYPGHPPPAAAAAAAASPLPWYDTPAYAAPELALGLAPSPAADMWSLAACVYELATGEQLLPLPPQLLAPEAVAAALPGVAEFHLALVEALLGRPPPAALLRRAPAAADFYDVGRRPQPRLWLGREFELPPPCGLAGRLRRVAARQARGGGESGGGREEGQRRRAQVQQLAGRLGSGGGGGGSPGAAVLAPRTLCEQGLAMPQLLAAPAEWEWGSELSGGWDEAEWGGLCNFLAPMLQWDPRRRPPAHVAAQHPWLQGA